MNKPVVLALFISWVAWANAAPAHAHVTSTSFMELDTAADGAVTLRWDLALHDLIWSVFVDADYDGVATWEELQSAAPALETAVLAQIDLSRDGARCVTRVAGFTTIRREDGDYLSMNLRADCPRAGLLSITGPLFMSGDPAQSVLLTLRRGVQRISGVINVSRPAWTEPGRVSAWESFKNFVWQGVVHVAIGYDHIAFILLLLLPSVLRPVDGRWQGATGVGQVTRDIVTIVTAFTVAHSTTLALAATRTVVLPTQPVEVAIAASIAVAGLINLFPGMSRLRLALAFGFGLVHGFGFANVLGEIDTGGSSLLPLLAGFNVGVELAQLAIVALVLPVIYSIRDTRWYAGGVLPLGSCALGAAGLVWLLQRLPAISS
jgi:hypothetical protein